MEMEMETEAAVEIAATVNDKSGEKWQRWRKR
jgi:hypothetical protein